MDSLKKAQAEICLAVGSPHVEAAFDSKVLVAADTIKTFPLNGTRLPAGEGESGWRIWGGEDVPADAAAFETMTVSDLQLVCPQLLKYLGLPPGWRVLWAPGEEDVRFDHRLLSADKGTQ